MVKDLGEIFVPPVLKATLLKTLKRDIVDSKYGKTEVIPYSRNEEYFNPILRTIKEIVEIEHIQDAKVLFLSSGCKIDLHKDSAAEAIHLVLITNDQCKNTWGDTELHMEQSHIYLVNLTELHKSENNGDTERAHLMITGKFKHVDNSK